MADIIEEELAAEMGISRDDIRDLRDRCLIEGEDWHRKKARVFFSAQGVQNLKKELAVGVGLALEKNEAGGALASEAGAEEMVVVNVPGRNRRIMSAQKKVGGALVRVQVRDNGNFMPGMEIKARAGGEFPDLYVLEGRAPRWRGKW